MPSRPWLIWVFCVLCFIRAFAVMVLMAFPPGGRATDGQAGMVLVTLGLLASMVGYFQMKRWGPFVLGTDLVIFVLLNHAALKGIADPSLFIFVLGLGTAAVHFKRMT